MTKSALIIILIDFQGTALVGVPAMASLQPFNQ